MRAVNISDIDLKSENASLELQEEILSPAAWGRELAYEIEFWKSSKFNPTFEIWRLNQPPILASIAADAEKRHWGAWIHDKSFSGSFSLEEMNLPIYRADLAI